MNRLLTLGFAVLLLASTAAGARAATPVPAQDSALATIVMSSVAGVQLCDLALRKSENRDIHAFCRTEISEDEQTALTAMQLAQRLGATDVKLEPLPRTPSVIDSLTQYSGHDFDRAFLLAQIESRENDEEAIRYAADVATNVTLKRYEDGMLPRVERSLQRAESTLHTISADQP